MSTNGYHQNGQVPELEPTVPAPKPWERQPGEGSKAFHAFTHYRDMKNRSLEQSYRDHQKDCVGKPGGRRRPTRWHFWSHTHHWVDRCTAYDNWLDSQVIVARSQSIREAAKRHEQLGRLMQNRAIEQLMKIEEGTTLPLSVIVNMAKIGVDLERLSLSQPTEIARIEETEREDFWDQFLSDPDSRAGLLELLHEVAGDLDQEGPPAS